MNLDTAFWIGGSAAQVAVVAMLLYRSAWRRFPVFGLYNLWSLAANGSAFAIQRHWPGTYLTAYVFLTVLDSIFEFGVILELAWSVLRPVRLSIPQFRFSWVALSFVLVAAVVWPFASIQGFGDFPPQWHLLMHLQQTIYFLRMLVFLLLAGSSQLLSIGWRDRELQIATGLGFDAFVGLAVAILRIHHSDWSFYYHLNQVLVASSILSLLYWVICFAQKEPERREFTPHMRGLLLAIAGNARTTRLAMVAPERSRHQPRSQR